MSSVLIVGGSIAGLTSGLILARAGHQVTVLERDAAAMPETVEDAANWMRPTVPQVQHAHGFGALTRAILARRLPDVLGDLLAFGAGEYHLRQWMPPTAANAETITARRGRRPFTLATTVTTYWSGVPDGPPPPVTCGLS
jgi:2-polyprenyl-6-methoxyphenol hydroxylase-like FAD-dependent oxidoreductase